MEIAKPDMIRVDSNISNVIRVISDELGNIDVNKMTREQATTLMAEMRKRIHQQGKASDGGAIGKYSKGYLAVRSGVFGNSGKFVKGKSKGKIKNAGTYTKGKSTGSARVKYNRGRDSKVILSLTRQMESDMILIPIENGTAIGYSNSDNFNKSQWAEKTYKKAIFSATDEEVAMVLEIGRKYLTSP